MTHVANLIKQLRRVRTELSYRIAGAAELESIADDARLGFPALYVVYAGCQATTKNPQNQLEIETDNRFKVIAVVDNNDDRTGKKAQDVILTLRTSIFSAILNYELDADHDTLEFVSDRMLRLDKSRYFHEFEFRMRGRLDPSDGFQLPTDNLDKIYADINVTDSDEDNYPDAQMVADDLYDP